MAAAATAPSDLKYPTPPTLVVGTKMTSLAPTVVGQVASYKVSPALPAGLSLNPTAASCRVPRPLSRAAFGTHT
jgi:hypothetical protein